MDRRFAKTVRHQNHPVTLQADEHDFNICMMNPTKYFLRALKDC